MTLLRVAIVSSLALVLTAWAEDGLDADPQSPELRSLAQPLVVDESRYGCGPLREPGQTYYVKTDGDDRADGRSWDRAWRTLRNAVRRLKPGETLLIGEGEYCDYVNKMPSGEPGRPIRVMAAPRQRVVVTASKKVGPFRRTAGTRHCYEVDVVRPDKIELYTATWEADSRNVLEPAGSFENVDTLPGSFFFDSEKDKMYVRFSDGRPGDGRYVYILKHHQGMVIERDRRYLHVRGIWFKHAPFYGVGVKGDHVTVEDCAFFANWGCGLFLGNTARWCLVKNNYGYANEDRGTIRTCLPDAHDNLIVGNWCDPSPPTGRSGRSNQQWCINNYGGAGYRCHVVNNVLNDAMSFRWKQAVMQSVFEGNVCAGTVYCVGTRADKSYGMQKPEDRVILRSNTILGRVSWAGEPLGPDGWNGNWVAPDKASCNNFVADGKPDAIEAARFADPHYLDCRLQSDSPLRGKAVGGGDVGAFRHSPGRIYYVGPDGSDANAGTSERLAFRTLAKATSTLRAGDTLYVMGGRYAAPLVISASGEAAKPIVVRAYHKESFSLPDIVVNGSHVRLEHLRVTGAPGDAVRVAGAHVTVTDGLFCGASGAGLRGNGAKALTVNHCTLASNRVGLALEQGSSNTTVRNSIIALNRGAQLQVDESSQPGYRGYNTCHFGAGLDENRVAAETDSIAADPQFVDPGKGDYRIQWTSPCRYLGELAPPAGAYGVQLRQARITDLEVCGVQQDSAVVAWRTPDEETNSSVRYRALGEPEWRNAASNLKGTHHAVGLSPLERDTEYEATVVAKGSGMRRSEQSRVTFRTRKTSRKPTRLYVAADGDDAGDGRSPKTAWRTSASSAKGSSGSCGKATRWRSGVACQVATSRACGQALRSWLHRTATTA